MSASTLWHYTLPIKLRDILDTGIRRARLHVQRGERKAVWFTQSETWEPTVSPLLLDPISKHSRRASIEETISRFGDLARLSVSSEIARYTWADHRLHSGIDPRDADKLERDAIANGSDPSLWRVTYRDVPVQAISSVEASNDGVTWRVVLKNVGGGLQAIDSGFVASLKPRSQQFWLRQPQR